MNKILAFLGAIAKPVLELANNLIDPEKKRQRKIIALENQISDLESFIDWVEGKVKTQRKKDVKERYCTRLAVALHALAGLRRDLAKYKR
jgi:hypothetical protein